MAESVHDLIFEAVEQLSVKRDLSRRVDRSDFDNWVRGWCHRALPFLAEGDRSDTTEDQDEPDAEAGDADPEAPSADADSGGERSSAGESSGPGGVSDILPWERSD